MGGQEADRQDKFNAITSYSLLLTSFLSFNQALRAQEIVSFDSLDKGPFSGPTTLRGYLFKPTGPGPFPAVVGLHGCGGLLNKQGEIVSRETTWADLLTARGYVVLFPDSFTSPKPVPTA
jgi:poly(3-hydroxybutyrate) depolymerase